MKGAPLKAVPKKGGITQRMGNRSAQHLSPKEIMDALDNGSSDSDDYEHSEIEEYSESEDNSLSSDGDESDSDEDLEVVIYNRLGITQLCPVTLMQQFFSQKKSFRTTLSVVVMTSMMMKQKQKVGIFRIP